MLCRQGLLEGGPDGPLAAAVTGGGARANASREAMLGLALLCGLQAVEVGATD